MKAYELIIVIEADSPEDAMTKIHNKIVGTPGLAILSFKEEVTVSEEPSSPPS